jgi:hypothetical protein
VGEDEVFLGEDEVVHEEEVEVEGARPPPRFAGPVSGTLTLDAVQFGEEIARRKVGIDDGGGVEEVGLGDGADGRGLVERGGGDESRARQGRKAEERGPEVGIAIADV